MVYVRDILAALERIAPARYAFSFDKVGLQVGEPHQAVTKAVVSLDASLAAVRFAKEQEAQLLLSHHPLIFNPVSQLTAASHQGRVLLALVKSDVSFIAAHTNWDSARGGINDSLASALGLTSLADFGTGAEVSHVKMVVYAPTSNVDRIIDAATEAGAGVIGDYRRCAFKAGGTGTFEAGGATSPAIGEPGSRTEVGEMRIEMIAPAAKRHAIERSVRRAHEYEEPAIDFLELAPTVEQPAGRVGSLALPLTLGEFSAQVSETLGQPAWTWGEPSRTIKKVAVVGGAADGEWMAAQRAGADVLITGEVKQHVALEASESGFALIAAGHYATENIGCHALRARMDIALPAIEWLTFDPPPGTSGRPC